MKNNSKTFYTKHKDKLFIGLLIVILGGGLLFGFYRNKTEYLEPISKVEVQDAFSGIGWQLDQTKQDIFGATFRPINFKTSLAERLTEGGDETTIDVSSVTTIDDHTLTMADLGDIIYLMINPGAANWELVACTGLSGTQFSGCTRGYVSYANSTATARIKAHGPGETIIITNDDHYLSTQYTRKDEDETISGIWRHGEKIIFGSTTDGYIDWDSTNEYLVYSNNGTDSFAIGGADSTLTSGDGISLIGSLISVRLASSTPALEFNNDGLRILLDPYEALLSLGADGLFSNTSTTPTELAVLFGIDTSWVTASGFDTLMASSTSDAFDEHTHRGLVQTYLAGETIEGGTASPTAVMLDLNGADKLYYSNATNASTTFPFIGFALDTQTANASTTVQTSGVVHGFTGLTQGASYYLTNTNGELSTTAGTNTYKVGVAVSQEELEIDTGNKIYVEDVSGDNSGGGSWSNTYTLGFRPSKITFYCRMHVNVSKDYYDVAFAGGKYYVPRGTWINGEYTGLHEVYDTGVSQITDAFCAFTSDGGAIMKLTVTPNVDGFTVIGTNSGSSDPTHYDYYYIAEE